jgi:hypothetical protein
MVRWGVAADREAVMAKPFCITAIDHDEPVRATRLQRGSAMVLADKWATQGFENIRITDTFGRKLDRAGFRAFIRGQMRGEPDQPGSLRSGGLSDLDQLRSRQGGEPLGA